MEAERAMSMSEQEDKQQQGEQGQDEEDQEQSDVKFIFKEQRDEVPATPYYDDGNPQLYTEQNMQKREELKDDPIVKQAISDFIKVNFNLSSQGIVSKSDYMKVFKNACSKLRPKFDKDQIQSMVNQQYQRDNDHQQVQKIDEQHLFNSLYQLADIWCPNIDAQQIKQFFKQLKFQMKYQNQNDASAYDPLQF